jgi:hypothetical protein
VPAHGSTHGCHGVAPGDCSAQLEDHSQSAGWASPWVPRCPCLPIHPQPLCLTDSCWVGYLWYWSCSSWQRRWWWGGGPRWRVDGATSLLLALFPFLVSWGQRGRRELSFFILFFILVCGRWLYYGQENLLCVACKTYYAIYLCLDDYHAYLSIFYVYVMKGAVVTLCPCYIDVILCIFTIWHIILSLDYTYSFRHPTFWKIVQLNSHMLLSVNLMLVNPCISYGGAACANLENKTLLCLIVEKL